jgi:hypothetical protein
MSVADQRFSVSDCGYVGLCRTSTYILPAKNIHNLQYNIPKLEFEPPHQPRGRGQGYQDVRNQSVHHDPRFKQQTSSITTTSQYPQIQYPHHSSCSQ